MEEKKTQQRKQWNINCIALIFSILLLSSCALQKPQPEDVIMNYVNKNFKNINTEKKLCVFIISENGCVNCNREMSYIATQFIDMKDIYFIINANSGGTLVDISPYWEAKKQEQISYDTINYFNDNDLKMSYAVFIKNNKIDTILDSDAKTLFDNKKYIIDRIINKE